MLNNVGGFSAYNGAQGSQNYFGNILNQNRGRGNLSLYSGESYSTAASRPTQANSQYVMTQNKKRLTEQLLQVVSEGLKDSLDQACEKAANDILGRIGPKLQNIMTEVENLDKETTILDNVIGSIQSLPCCTFTMEDANNVTNTLQEINEDVNLITNELQGSFNYTENMNQMYSSVKDKLLFFKEKVQTIHGLISSSETEFKEYQLKLHQIADSIDQKKQEANANLTLVQNNIQGNNSLQNLGQNGTQNQGNSFEEKTTNFVQQMGSSLDNLIKGVENSNGPSIQNNNGNTLNPQSTMINTVVTDIDVDMEMPDSSSEKKNMLNELFSSNGNLDSNEGNNEASSQNLDENTNLTDPNQNPFIQQNTQGNKQQNQWKEIISKKNCFIL